MNSYKLEDIEKLAAENGMRTCIIDCGVYNTVHIFLGDFRVGVFKKKYVKKKYEDVPVYELLWTYTRVSDYSIVGNINFTDSVAGERFFGNLHTVYENMSKKYKELLKTIKTAEIKNCGGEYVVG